MGLGDLIWSCRQLLIRCTASRAHLFRVRVGKPAPPEVGGGHHEACTCRHLLKDEIADVMTTAGACFL